MTEELDGTTKGVRFGCGALAGVLIGLSLVVYSFEPSLRNLVAACLVSAILCGGLAVIYGERFWEFLSRTLWWW